MNDQDENFYVIPQGPPMTPGTWFLTKTGNPPVPLILASCPKCQAMNEVFGPGNNQFILKDGKCRYACTRCQLRALIQLQNYAGY